MKRDSKRSSGSQLAVELMMLMGKNGKLPVKTVTKRRMK
jgi:hypothetical protein